VVKNVLVLPQSHGDTEEHRAHYRSLFFFKNLRV
jgi:hypothetical protein